MNKEEIIDIYDKNKNKTGKTKIRHKEPLEPDEYTMGVQAIIINSKKQILISQRSKTKKLAPLKWECNGGALLAGEDEIEGTIREIYEELGIELQKEKAIFLKTAQNDHKFKEIYLFKEDIEISQLKFQDGEAEGAKWVDINEFMSMFKNGEIVQNVNFDEKDYEKCLMLLENNLNKTMEDEIVLVEPNKQYEEQAINLINEVDKADTDPNIRFSGFNSLEEYRNNYEEWLVYIQNQLNKETVQEGLVTANTFFAIRKRDNKLVGIINIRHELNDYLLNYGGHIGYSVLPSERRKGYAYKQLLLALEFCKKINIKKVLITCVDYNIGSRKTIEKAGGKLENFVFNPNKNVEERRYWINN